MQRLSAMFLIFGILLVLSLAPTQAQAFNRYEVGQNLDYGRDPATGADRFGVFVSNRPGGLYMGRLFVGDAFSALGTGYKSLKGESYFEARALGEIGECAWVGPSGRVENDKAWAQRSGTTLTGCSPSVSAWLGTADRESFNDGSAIYSHVNCPPPSTNDSDSLGTFGGYTFTTRATPVYYNLDWTWNGIQYDARSARDKVGELPVGTGLHYRYTTKGGKFANVFMDGNSGSYGWAFVNSDAVPHVGYWSPASDPPNYKQFDCNSATVPATDVARPWTLWLTLGGQSIVVTA
jgi:hypothetical protein